MSLRRRIAWPLLVMALGCGLWWVAGPARRVTPDALTGSQSGDAAAATSSLLPASRTHLPAPTDSLHGTTVDGAITLDAAGRAQPDRAMRRMFDHFLTRLGERDLHVIRDDVRRHLQPRLAPSALAQTLTWFDRYVALEQESAALGVSGDPRADLQQRRALRQRRLGGEVATAWYGEDERQAEHALARQALAGDRSLDSDTRRERLAELEREQGAAQDATRTASDTVALAMAQSRRFAAAATPSSQRWAEREALFGAEAAGRLAALDTRRAEWNARVDAYRTQRQRILVDSRLSAAQRARALDALLAPFTPNERLRVDALTRADAGRPF